MKEIIKGLPLQDASRPNAKYPVRIMEVGDSFQPDVDSEEKAKRYASAYSSRLNPKLFRAFTHEGVVYIQRVA